jgi:hypothetical protein
MTFVRKEELINGGFYACAKFEKIKSLGMKI